MKAFVTGSSGHLGANLVRHLLAEGWQVRCLIHRDVRALAGLDVERVEGKLTEPASLIPLLENIDVVFHSAAYVAVENVDIPLMEKININGTESICAATLAAGVGRLIHFSSIHAFQQRPTNEPLTEERPLVNDEHAAPYDRTKAEAQRRVLAACEQGLNASIIHPTGIIGLYDYKPSRMGQVIIDMSSGKMPFTINTGFNWVDSRDVCQTALNCIKQGRKGQHYLVPGAWATIRQIADIIAEVLEKRITYFTAPFWTAYLALPFAGLRTMLTGKRPSFSKGSLHALAVQCKDIPGTLARDELKHQTRTLEETIKDTLQWMIKQGQIQV